MNLDCISFIQSTYTPLTFMFTFICIHLVNNFSKEEFNVYILSVPAFHWNQTHDLVVHNDILLFEQLG